MILDQRNKRFKEGQKVLISLNGMFEATVVELKSSIVCQEGPMGPTERVSFQLSPIEIGVAVVQPIVSGVFILDDQEPPQNQPDRQLASRQRLV